MIKNFFITAWRNLKRNKTFTLLNLGGLTLSLTAALVIFFWITSELNFDKSGANADRVYRVGLTLEATNQPDKQFAVTSPLLAPVLLKDYPEVEKAVRLTPGNVMITNQQEHFFTDKFLYADYDFFECFGYTLLKGNPSTVLLGRNSAVVTETIAKKLFGEASIAIGKTILVDDTTLLNITGVAKDLSTNNHFHFDVVAPILLLGPDALTGWWNDSYYTYLLLKDPKSANPFEQKMATVMDRYNAEQNKALGFRGLHFLQPISKIHLNSELRGELESNGSIKSIRIFTGIAIFLLIVACINYINLTTANSFRRAKEIGLRKVSGAAFYQLFGQFISESVLIVLIALLFAIGATQLCLPFFNMLAGTQISLLENFSFSFVLYLIGSGVIIGFVAGLYPAFYLSKVRPVQALKKIAGKEGGSFPLRRILVVFQFSLTIILIIATFVAVKQLQYMQSQNLGLHNDQVVSVPLRNAEESINKEIIKEEFQKINGVEFVTSSSSTPGRRLSNIVVLPEGVASEHTQTMNTLAVDDSFFATYGIEIAAGRGFSTAFNDSNSFVLNETAVKELGWGKPENAIGKGFEWGLGKKGKIIGVVKDFHFNSLQKELTPIVMHLLGSNWYGYVSARVNVVEASGVLANMQLTWKKLLPNHPFEYFFVDEDFNKQYQSDRRLANLSTVFSLFIICISCMGLFGLVMIAISHRIKEIGIRKVLGASVAGVTLLVSKDFLKLVLIAFIIATPLAWILMNKWLLGYAYRISIPWWIFMVAGFAAFLIAFITISVRALNAALINPVKSLRAE